MPAQTRRRLLTLSDGSEEIAEMDGAGAVLRRFIAGPGTDMPLAMVAANGARSFVHTDRQGSTVALSNYAGVVSEGPYTYDAYGNGAAATGFPFKYTGRRLDPETGLYYYRARYYSSALGRFLQTDPIGYADQMNLYAYVGNDPMNATDPSGKCAQAYCDPMLSSQMAQEEAEIGKMSPAELKAYKQREIAIGKAHLEIATEIIPGISDGKAIATAIENPTAGNITEAVSGVVPGVGEARGIAKAASIANKGSLPKVPTGPGTVPKALRDPQRTFSPAQREAKRAEQGELCGNGCGTKIDSSNSQGHDKQRHADGGPTTSENHVEVCLNCHKDKHSAD